jgi:hypothetical protein
VSTLPADDEPTRRQWRDLEASVNARFQAVAARFSTIDRRLTGLDGRLDGQDRRQEATTGRFDVRFRSMHDRFDATDARMDLVQEQVAARFQRERRDHRRSLLVLGAISAAGWVLVLALLVATR